MYNFTFCNPTTIHFGQGQIKTLQTELSQYKKVLLAYGQGSIKKNGVYDQILANLPAHVAYVDFAGIEPNPKYETLMQAIELARKEKIDFILAIGGGSVIDGVKFISAGINFAGDPWEIMQPATQQQAFTQLNKAVPFGTILTLPGTGSEMNCGAVVSKKSSNDKLVFMHPNVFPKFSILDPTTTYSLPLNQTINGIVDAFIHVVEQYMTFDVKASIQDRFAEGIMLTLIEEAKKVLLDGNNYDVRANIMWSATVALNGYISAGVPVDWATHRIGHEVTALHGLDHAQTLAILLPSVLRINQQDKKDKLLQYAQRVWNLNVDSNNDENAIIEQAIQKTEEFFHSLNMPTKLKSYNITAQNIPAILQKLQEHKCINLGERGNITLDVAEKILLASC